MYRKFTADHIYTGNELLTGNQVLITNDEGVIIDLVDKSSAGEDVQNFSGILSPGFINTHCHLELSHLKAIIAEGSGLVGFVQQVMTKRETNIGGITTAAHMEIKQAAMKAAAEEMYGNGIVAVGDICNTVDSITVKTGSKIRWHNFIETSGFVDAVAEARLAAMIKVYHEFIKQLLGSPTSISPHAPYSVSKTLFEAIDKFAASQLVTIHNQEAVAENELYVNKSGGFLDLYKNFGIDIAGFVPTGKSAFASWLPYFTYQQPIISVHNTFIEEADLRLANQRSLSGNGKVFFCLCANANKYIEDKMPPISLIKRNSDNIIIGTDSYASNHQLSILDELRTIQQEGPNATPLAELLKWATINGAKALQMDDLLGSFEKGKAPGVVLIENIADLLLTSDSSSRRIL